MPSRIFFTSSSVAAKMDCIFAVTSARLASSLDLVLPLSATSLASAAALGALHAGDAGLGLRGRFGLGLRDDVLLLLAELAGCGVGVCGRRLLVGERLLEVRLVGLRELLLADLGVRHFLVGLVLAGLEVELFGRRRFRYGTRGGNRCGGPCCSGPIGVTGFGTALDVSGGAAVAVSMSLACPSLPWVTRPLTSPLTSPALPDFA